MPINSQSITSILETPALNKLSIFRYSIKVYMNDWTYTYSLLYILIFKCK